VSQSPSASESNVLLEERGFRYSIATEKFADAIVRLLSESFSREPMTAALGISARELESLAARFMPECTTNGLSVIAAPADDPVRSPASLSAAILSHQCRRAFQTRGSIRSARR
jgi:hypothetical protein